MADGDSPKARPKRVKPDRPRPATSFRPTGGRGGGEQRSGGQRPSGQRPDYRPGGGRPRPAGSFNPDSRIPRGPEDWSTDRSAERRDFDRPGDRPSFDRPRFSRPRDDRPRDDRPRSNRPWQGAPEGARPRFDGARPERAGLGFRGRPEGAGRWPSGPAVHPPSDNRPRRDEGSGEERPRPRFVPPRPRFDRPDRPEGGRPPFAGRGRPEGQRPFGARPARPFFDRRPDRSFTEPGRPDARRPAGFSRPGLEPAEADLVEAGDEIVAGRRPVEEAFVARREARRLLVVPQRREALEKLVLHATSLRIPIVEVEGGSLTALTGFDGHQGVALVVAPRRYASVTEILARAIERGEPPFVLVLDSLEDPQNVGTLLRSAEAAGAHGVIFPTKRQAPLSPAAVKASAGAVEHLLLAPVDDLAGALADLHVAGLRIVGAEAEAPLTVRQVDLRGPLAIVVGSEGRGISGPVRRRLDLALRIPMRGKIQSLNAGVAGSILLFAAAGQRPGPTPDGTGSAQRGESKPEVETEPDPEGSAESAESAVAEDLLPGDR